MFKLQNSSENSHQFLFQLKRYRPSLTIQSEPNYLITKQQISDLLNFKQSGYPQTSQPGIQRNLRIRPSLKLTKITPSVTELADHFTPIKKRTISLGNLKKVDFNPSVLVIYSENGVKKREKLIDDCKVKRKGTRKNCMILIKNK
ncbi:unnamed protein product (macronuclear) [Paramecium tetraurelia]|uniref:Uncharacterized protein n=1 Tax=Paramecium tetraurelia TaxID=5888 RepID=A0BF45_PARTE|nr:uncharacterized protein GSPATT00028197001 [Paramecium tetraurelia]CAK57162.1 unnamed protein product [Paramecium tetraurelia]|eukprot:XP_001424560.1 hypothetical protein (macronuclear) [Paramecium tetraurelia strain d4-2]